MYNKLVLILCISILNTANSYAMEPAQDIKVEDDSYLTTIYNYLQQTYTTVLNVIDPKKPEEEQNVINKISRYFWKNLGNTSTQEMACLKSVEEKNKTHAIYQKFMKNFCDEECDPALSTQYMERIKSTALIAKELHNTLKDFNNKIGQVIEEKDRINMLYSIIPTLQNASKLKKENKDHLIPAIATQLTQETTNAKNTLLQFAQKHNLDLGNIMLESSQIS